LGYHRGVSIHFHMIDINLLFEKGQLQQGMHIADFGCGRTAHVVLPAARIVGEKGIVYAVDIMKDIIHEVDKRAKDNGFFNVQPVWADLERIGASHIPNKSLDVGFLVNTLVQSNNRHAILEECARLLKDKARLIIVDWSKKGLRFGPQDGRFVDFQDIKDWAKMRGFVVQEEFICGPYHSGIVLYRNQ